MMMVKIKDEVQYVKRREQEEKKKRMGDKYNKYLKEDKDEKRETMIRLK